MVDGNERETPDVPAALNNFSVTGKVKQSKVGRSKVACPSDLQPNAGRNRQPQTTQPPNRQPRTGQPEQGDALAEAKTPPCDARKIMQTDR
jgi:hypothetical protein